jgi:hypothetical protein
MHTVTFLGLGAVVVAVIGTIFYLRRVVWLPRSFDP